MSALATTGLPPWVVPAAIIHVALFLVMILPTWRGFHYARLGGPLALVWLIPGAGLIFVALVMLVFGLRRAGWPISSFVLLFVPVVNALYMWMYGFGRWTVERERIRRRTAEAAAKAASEDTMAPSRRLELDRESGSADIADAATEQGPEAPISSPLAGDGPSLGGPAAAAPSASDPTEIEGAQITAVPAAEAVPAPAGAETPPAPPPQNPTPQPEDDMTHVAGTNGSPSDGWLIRGIDGRSQNFAMLLKEADLLDADNGILIGRSNRAHFIINDESVSRNHARLILAKGQLMLEDLDSMNGVWMNGDRLATRAPEPLSIGSVFTIGKVNLRVDPAE